MSPEQVSGPKHQDIESVNFARGDACVPPSSEEIRRGSILSWRWACLLGSGVKDWWEEAMVVPICSLAQQPSKSATFKFLEFLKLSSSNLNPKTPAPGEKGAMRSILDDTKVSKTNPNAVFLQDFYWSNTTKNFKSQANSEGLLSYPTTFKISNLQIPWVSKRVLPILNIHQKNPIFPLQR